MENAKTAPEQKQFKTIRDSVWASDAIGGTTKLVALRLVEHWPRVWPSQQFLADICGVSVRTIRVAIRELEETEVISTIRRGPKTSSYKFVGVSIPPLGRRRTAPDGSERNDRQILPINDRQNLPPRSADSAGHSPITTKTEFKGGSPRARVARSGARDPKTPQNAPPRFLAAPAVSDRPLFTSFLGWEMPQAFRTQCISRGISAERFDFRFEILRNKALKDGPVWNLEIVVLEQLERWLRWERQDSKPDCGAAAAPQIDFPSDLVKRAGGWVPKPAELEYAKLKAVDPTKFYSAYVRAGKAENKSDADNDRDFRKALEMHVRKRSKSPVQHQQEAA